MGGQSAQFVPPTSSMDPFLTGVAGNVLRQQGQTYLQRGQAFMQSKIGIFSGGMMHYYFDITPDYVGNKLLMLLAPFLKRWQYTRSPEHLSGGHKYLPPRLDTAAPDLYIPLMALWTYCILMGVVLFASSTFKPDLIYTTVSGAVGAWWFHTFLLKLLLWLLGIPSAASLIDLSACAGYTFTAASVSLLSHLVLGRLAYHVVWFYGSLCMGIFLVRTMKVIVLADDGYRPGNKRYTYLLLGLAVFQFPFNAWLATLPAL